MKNITKKTIALTLALVFALGIVVGVYNDANATEVTNGTKAVAIRSEKTGLKKAEAVYHHISEEEYEAVVARENADKQVKYTDSYWSKFSEPYYNYADGMTAEQKQIYDKVYAQLYKYIEGGVDFEWCDTGIDEYYATPAISCGNIDKDALDRIHYVIIYEHPELFYLDSLAYIGETESGEKTLQFEVFEDFAKGKDRTAGAKKFKERIEWFLSQVDGKTFYDKEKQIHDLICENAIYNYTDHSQSAYSTIVESETVCAGYSEGFNMLCHAVGIPAMSVTSASHEWSQVKLGNTWYAVDVTWDDEDEDDSDGYGDYDDYDYDYGYDDYDYDYGYDDYDYGYGYDYGYRYAKGASYEYFNKSDKTITYEDEDDAHKIEESPWDYVGRPKCPKDYTHENDSMNVYRLYNQYTGEHFYTPDANESSSLQSDGWTYEGIAWISPVASYSKNPVYRLYYPSGDHHYTTSANERDTLIKQDWSYEGESWYSTTSYGTPLYRLYNPNLTLGSHHYTTDENEVKVLKNSGWIYEGIGWYGM